MRWYFFAILLLCIPSLLSGRVLLNEVYYDHSGRDEGYEFIELINLTGEPMDLGGYALEFHDGSSPGWSVVWRGASGRTIPPDGLFVVGGEHVTPAPDFYEELGLQNGPDAVRLTFEGAVVDVLGYGDLEGIGFFETSPAPDVDSGFSLCRRPDGADTDDNSVDFAVLAPSPGAFNIPRHDLELTPEKTKVVDVLESSFVEHMVFCVRNLGTVVMEQGVVTLSDSTDVGMVDEQSVELSQMLAPGESVSVDFDVTMTVGYHWVRVRVVCALDERGANDTATLVRRVGVSPVVISEVMCDPGGSCPEFIELFNNGGAAHGLSGSRARDAAHDFELISLRSVDIPAFGCIVVTPDAEALLECFPGLAENAVIEMEGPWPSLNATGSGSFADSVIVADRWSIPLDRVSYPPQPTGTKGKSLERVDVFPGTRDHVWALSRAPGGASPGSISNGSIAVPPQGSAVTAVPNPFDPYTGEVMVVTVPDAGAGVRVVASIFDIEGGRVADMGSTTAFPAVFMWDGRDSGGNLARAGLYVLACEFYTNSDGVRWVEKVVVGCARRKQ